MASGSGAPGCVHTNQQPRPSPAHNVNLCHSSAADTVTIWFFVLRLEHSVLFPVLVLLLALKPELIKLRAVSFLKLMPITFGAQ